MGSWFCNLHVRKTDGITEKSVVDHICKIMTSKGFVLSGSESGCRYAFAIVTDEDSGWYTLYSDSFAFDPYKGLGEFGSPMSEGLHTDILGISCFDSDFLFFNLIDSDGNIDAHAGVGFYEEDDWESHEDLSLWEHKVKDFSRFLNCIQEEYVFAEEVLAEIAPCLNLPEKFSNCGFDYLDELPEGERISYLYFK